MLKKYLYLSFCMLISFSTEHNAMDLSSPIKNGSWNSAPASIIQPTPFGDQLGNLIQDHPWKIAGLCLAGTACIGGLGYLAHRYMYKEKVFEKHTDKIKNALELYNPQKEIEHYTLQIQKTLELYSAQKKIERLNSQLNIQKLSLSTRGCSKEKPTCEKKIQKLTAANEQQKKAITDLNSHNNALVRERNAYEKSADEWAGIYYNLKTHDKWNQSAPIELEMLPAPDIIVEVNSVKYNLSALDFSSDMITKLQRALKVDVKNAEAVLVAISEIKNLRGLELDTMHQDIVFEILHKIYKTPNGYDSKSLRIFSQVNKNYLALLQKPEFRKFLMQHRCPPICFEFRDYARYQETNDLVYALCMHGTEGPVERIKNLGILYSDAQKSPYINPYECKGDFSPWTSACVSCDVSLMQFFLNNGVNVNAPCDCKINHYTVKALPAIIWNPLAIPESQQFMALDLLAQNGLTIPSPSAVYELILESFIFFRGYNNNVNLNKSNLFYKFIELRCNATSDIVSDQDKICDFKELLKIHSLNHNYTEIEPALIILLKNGVDPRKTSDGQSLYEYAYKWSMGEQLVKTVRQYASHYIDENVIAKLSQHFLYEKVGATGCSSGVNS